MQKRELWKVILFGIITLGIYDLVWLYTTRNEMVEKGHKIPTVWLLFSPLLLLVVVAILQFGIHFILRGASPDAPVAAARLLFQVVSTLSVLLGMVGIIALIPISIYWMYRYCQAVEAVTNGTVSFGFAFGLWFLLNFFSVGFVWPAIIQDGFNKIADQEPPTQPSHPSSPQSPLTV